MERARRSSGPCCGGSRAPQVGSSSSSSSARCSPPHSCFARHTLGRSEPPPCKADRPPPPQQQLCGLRRRPPPSPSRCPPRRTRRPTPRRPPRRLARAAPVLASEGQEASPPHPPAMRPQLQRSRGECGVDCSTHQRPTRDCDSPDWFLVPPRHGARRARAVGVGLSGVTLFLGSREEGGQESVYCRRTRQPSLVLDPRRPYLK
mmetsp:Transcript_46993/g.152520  ORF Transcript_46993/g.152520 Transcript_46993/m.152520 type:complete len:204 (-) Transcript_46993:21-632(-)